MPVRSNLDWEKARTVLESAGKDVLREAAEFMAARARQLCPVDTGFLRGSIVATSSKAGLVWNVVATAPYAEYVEFGHYSRGGVWVPPNPFMRTALAETIKRWPEFGKAVRVSRPGEGGGSTGATFGQ